MNVKAVFCDVDGTLLNSEFKTTEYTIEKIHQLKEKGILFGICTGRDAHSTEMLFERWQLKDCVDAIIGLGGAEIVDYELNVDLSRYQIDGEIIKKVVHHFQDMDVNFVIPLNRTLYALKDDRHVKLLSEKDELPYIVVDFDEFLNQSMPKVMIVCDPEAMNDVVERSKSLILDPTKAQSLITASILFEYMDPNISKSNGLKDWAELRGFSMSEICTFGDADNDYDMTLHAGVGVVMGNGSEKTKSVADYITDDNNHDGIGKFLDKYLLK